MKFEWEHIGKSREFNTYRARVYGGWVLNTCTRIQFNADLLLSETTVFIPDPEHNWSLE